MLLASDLMASFAEAPAGDVERGAKIFKTKCVVPPAGPPALCGRRPRASALVPDTGSARPSPGVLSATSPRRALVTARRVSQKRTTHGCGHPLPEAFWRSVWPAPPLQPPQPQSTTKPQARRTSEKHTLTAVPHAHHLRRVPTWAACSAACPARQRASPTAPPTRRPPSPGARAPCTTTCSTPRSTSPVRGAQRAAAGRRLTLGAGVGTGSRGAPV